MKSIARFLERQQMHMITDCINPKAAALQELSLTPLVYMNMKKAPKHATEAKTYT